MTAPWPCSTCGAAGSKNLGTRGYCAQHLAAFYRRLSPQAWRGLGIGLPEVQIAADGWTELRCVLCDATWSGAAFMRCGWCDEALIRQRDWQAELVLTPPDIVGGASSRDYDAVMKGWAERLARAVTAGLVTRDHAEAVWLREVRRVA